MSENFNYTYSAKTNDEIKKIREKYLTDTKEKTNYEKIIELDKKTTRKPTIFALIFGILSALILGAGMSMVIMWQMYIVGIIVGVIGMLLATLNYFVFKNMLKKEKEKVKDEILNLCNTELKNK